MSARSLRPFRAKVAWAYRKLGELGLIVGSSGNLSLRLGGTVLITPTGVPWDRVRPREVVALDLDGRVRGFGHPSSEWRLHLAIYRARPDARVVIHTHSPCATALACGELSIPMLHDEGQLLFEEGIPLAKHAPPGTQELAENAVAALGQARAALLSRHGVVVLGRTIGEALSLAEKIEEAAHLFLLSQGLRGH